ncbi:hypothetical protein TRFO_34681 [Tritrichomonas foetus]|uniref:Uncharacterized protein n=1 Tax=Tritrichomonas foetus TaxID=1144522 RepID=A0A1J4JK18_9EUKA|nr:hypothetical protein TRFO_34681 [Tritrichomonas foetus]|eukprot:OHS98953.1 hypothetical protein TRFO_34681 [Tritrichomonas foetus]
MNSNYQSTRLEERNEKMIKQRQVPSSEFISKLHELIISLPSQTDEQILETLNSITIFIVHFDFDLFNELSSEELQNLLNLIPFSPMRSKSEISSKTIDILTLLLKYNSSLIDNFNQQYLFNTIISNMIYVINSGFYISCVSFLYEALKIRNELRDMYLCYNLQDLVMRCSPSPDKVFFEFLTLLTLKPTFSMDLASIIIPSFIAQDVPQERTITVLKCIISVIRENNSIVLPVLSSDYLERTVLKLGNVVYTIATFFKFSNISLQICLNQSSSDKTSSNKESTNKICDNTSKEMSSAANAAATSFQRINICSILNGVLKNCGKTEVSFVDLMLASINNDKKSTNTSSNDKLLKHACNLMTTLLNFDVFLNDLKWIPEINFSSFLEEKLPYNTNKAIIVFLMNYALKMPKSSSEMILTETFLHKMFEFASSCEEEENEFVNGLSEIAIRFSSNPNIVSLIESVNSNYENIIIHYFKA